MAIKPMGGMGSKLFNWGFIYECNEIAGSIGHIGQIEENREKYRAV